MNKIFKQPLDNLNARIEALSLRERALVLVASLALIYAVNAYAILPLFKNTQAKLSANIVLKEQQVKSIGVDLKRLVSMREQESDAANRARMASLQESIAEMQRVPTLIAQLVAPTEMAQLVEHILAGNRQVEVLRLENIEAELMNPAPQEEGLTGQDGKQQTQQSSPQEKDAPPQPAEKGKSRNDVSLYKHGMLIEVKGRYWDIVRLLQSIEDQPRKILWGEVSLTTDKYPLSAAEITLYTVNLEPAWITI